MTQHSNSASATPVHATPAEIQQAAAQLRAGALVALPTETVYGLAGDATNDQAVARIFAAKGRPHFNPLIAHVPDGQAAAKLTVFPPVAQRLAQAFWPGGLTLVLPRAADCPVSALASAGLDTLAVRVPNHPVALALLREVGLPLAAPSANRSGQISPTLAEHVRTSLGSAVACVLEGGACAVGLESTVLDLTGAEPVILRPGALAREALAQVLGQMPRVFSETLGEADRPASPGLMGRHYAPALPLRLNATEPAPGEVWLTFGAVRQSALPEGVQRLALSETGDVVEAAANLFALLHAADRPTFRGIAVMPIPAEGLGLAINDRLRRAAWGR